MAVRDNSEQFIKILEKELIKFTDLSSSTAQQQAQTHLGPSIRRATQILTRRTKRNDWTNRVTGKIGKGHIDSAITDERGIRGSEERPSLRHQKAGRGEGPIYLNWGFEFDGSQNAFLITNRARHMRILLEGSPRHPVPLRRLQNRYLRFWRGRPLKWDAGPNDVVGWNFKQQISHPGIRGQEQRYQDYFEDAYDEALTDARYEKNVDNYIKARTLELRQNIISRLGT